MLAENNGRYLLAARATKQKKSVPKKAVSFAKFQSPSKKNDIDVQSLNKKRMYKRRGSKTPAMLSLSQVEMSTILGRGMDGSLRPQLSFKNSSSTPRRLSLMTTLKQKLESSCRIESSPTKPSRSFRSNGGDTKPRRMSITVLT